MQPTKAPSVLIVYFTLTKQVGRIADAMAQAFEDRGCTVSKALLEFTDERWVPKLSEFPMNRPAMNLAAILPAQIRHKTGEIRIPPAAQAGNYDLVVIASPTWWFQTSMPIRTYLESPEAKVVISGKRVACVSVSRRYFSINLKQQKRMAENDGGSLIDKTHFVVAGGQVKSMLAWLGYMKHGTPQDRIFGMKMPQPNLKPDYDNQARTFVNGVVNKVFAEARGGAG